MHAGEQTRVEIPHICKDDIMASDGQATYELYDGNRLVRKVTYQMSMTDFIGGVEPSWLPMQVHVSKGEGRWEEVSVDTVNVLFIGWVGAGKSSAVNTIATLLDHRTDGVKHGLAKVVGNVAHATTKLQPYAMGLEKKIKLIDVPGLEEGTYQNLELASTVKGLLKRETELVHRQGESKVHQDDIDTAHEREAHVVVVLMPAMFMDDSGKVELVKKHLATLQELDYNPFVMLAKVDINEPGIREDPLAFHTFEDLTAQRQELAEMLGYPLARIQYTVSLLVFSFPLPYYCSTLLLRSHSGV